MSLELALQQNTAAINTLIELLKGGAIPAPAPAEDVAMPDPAPAKKAKAKKEEPAPAPVEEKAEAPQAEVITYDMAAKPLIAVGSKHGRAKVMEILKPWNTTSLKGVPPEDYNAVICACELALA